MKAAEKYFPWWYRLQPCTVKGERLEKLQGDLVPRLLSYSSTGANGSSQNDGEDPGNQVDCRDSKILDLW